jgi:hypothetical protein
MYGMDYKAVWLGNMFNVLFEVLFEVFVTANLSDALILERLDTALIGMLPFSLFKLYYMFYVAYY